MTCPIAKGDRPTLYTAGFRRHGSGCDAVFRTGRRRYGTRAPAWDYASGMALGDRRVSVSLSSVGGDDGVASLASTAREALAGRTADVAFMGVAGCVSRTDRARLVEHLRRSELVGRADARRDAFTAWAGATAPTLTDVLVVAGTGSSVFTRSPTGVELLTALGTDLATGGGADLGRKALPAPRRRRTDTGRRRPVCVRESWTAFVPHPFGRR